MNREEQRHYSLLAARVTHARSKGYRSYPDSVWFTADELDSAEVELFKDYPAEIRRRMAKSGQALPDGSFPIADCGDAADAIRSIGRADPSKRGRAESHIRKRVRALRCQGGIFENWK